MSLNKSTIVSASKISKVAVVGAETDKIIDVTIKPSNLSVPAFILGIPLNKEIQDLPLFEKVKDTIIKLNNPHFVQIHCLIPQLEKPSCPNMTTSDTWTINGKCEYWSAFPSNSGGNSQPAWGSQWSVNAVDWRTGGPFLVTFPSSGVYWMQSRGPDLAIQNYVVDTRRKNPTMPKELVAKNIGSQKVRLSWSDTSNNEVAFHILVERYIGDKWIKLPSYIRARPNTTTIDYQAQAGYYRFSIRSAMSAAEEKWSFSRRIAATPSEPLQSVNFTTPSVIKYSNITSYVNLLVDGIFPNPIAPSNFGGTSKPDKTIYFVWQDNSENESVFHLLEDKWINGAWVRQPLIRIPANTRSYTRSARQPGRYRYAVRSAYRFPDTSVVRTSRTSLWIEFTIP